MSTPAIPNAEKLNQIFFDFVQYKIEIDCLVKILYRHSTSLNLINATVVTNAVGIELFCFSFWSAVEKRE